MLRCPKCGRTYETDTQKFCTHDGGRLAVDDSPPSSMAPTAYDLNQTVRTDAFDPEATVTRFPDLNKTVAAAPTSEIRSKDTGPAATPPPPQPTPPPQPPQYQQPPQPTPPARDVQPTIAFNQTQQPPPQQQPFYPPPPDAHAQQTPHGSASMPPQQQQQQQQQYAPAQYQQPAAAPTSRKKSSRMPLIVGLVVLVLLGSAAAWYFLVYKKGEAGAGNANVANANANANVTANANDNSNTTANTTANANTDVTPPPTQPPPNSTEFVNTKANLDGKLAENYSDFSFYYPNTWEKDPKTGVAGASNFIRVERRLPPDFTQENFGVSWYESKGTYEADSQEVFPKLVESLKARYEKSFPEFEVLSEGETTVNGTKGYEFRFQSVSKGTEKGDITLWGRVVFLPPGVEGKKNGVQLLMLTTSLAPELTSADDVGIKGELPMILNSFRLGSK
jgi:hypothetical protein